MTGEIQGGPRRGYTNPITGLPKQPYHYPAWCRVGEALRDYREPPPIPEQIQRELKITRKAAAAWVRKQLEEQSNHDIPKPDRPQTRSASRVGGVQALVVYARPNYVVPHHRDSFTHRPTRKSCAGQSAVARQDRTRRVETWLGVGY